MRRKCLLVMVVLGLFALARRPLRRCTASGGQVFACGFQSPGEIERPSTGAGYRTWARKAQAVSGWQDHSLG